MIPQDYSMIARFEVLEVEKDNKIQKRLVKVDQKDGTRKRYVTYENLFESIEEFHEDSGKHTGRALTFKKLQLIFANISMQQVIAYTDSCEVCSLKQGRIKKGVVVKPIVSSMFNSRCQVDCIDMQSQVDNSTGDNFKYIMVYQCHLTKFCTLEPLKDKSAPTIASKLIQIFKDKGAPLILHSDNGREFVNHVVSELLGLWPQCKMVNGKARHSQSQGSVERLNRDVESMLACWMRDTGRTDWSTGLAFVQYAKNSRHHTGIGRSPYRALYGVNPRMGLEHMELDKDLLTGVNTEEDLEKMFPKETEETEENVEENQEEHEPEEYQEKTDVQDGDITPDTAKEGTQEENAANKDEQLLSDGNETDTSEASISFSLGSEGSIHLADTDDLQLEEREGEVIKMKIAFCSSCRHPVPSRGLPSSCFSCASPICPNVPCCIDDLCSLCYKQHQIEIERSEAKKKQQKQADKMLEMSAKRFGVASVGTTVLLSIPDIDRGRCEFPHLKAIVLEVSTGGMYKLGCLTGILDSHYSRNQFSPTLEKFLTMEQVPKDKTISLRTAAREESMGSGQGFFR